jgi:hypothetical protein
MPFIHFIEILLRDYVLAPLCIERVTSENHYTNRFPEIHLNRHCSHDML